MPSALTTVGISQQRTDWMINPKGHLQPARGHPAILREAQWQPEISGACRGVLEKPTEEAKYAAVATGCHVASLKKHRRAGKRFPS